MEKKVKKILWNFQILNPLKKILIENKKFRDFFAEKNRKNF